MGRRYVVAAGCLAVLALVGPVSADTIWQVPTGDWSVGAHWTAGVPTGADTAIVGNGGVAKVTAGTALADILRLGASDGPAAVGALEGLGGAVRANAMQVGWAEVLGGEAYGTGALTGTDTDCLVAGLLQVGGAQSPDDGGLSNPIVEGTGTVTLLRGEVSFGALTVGEALADSNVSVSGTGTVVVDQSLFWGAGDWRIGYASSGYGGDPTGTGTVSISATPGSLSNLTSLTVGAGGGFRAGATQANGSLTYRGGVLVTGDWLIGRAGAGRGGSPQAVGAVDLDQVTLYASGTWVIGSAGADQASGLTAQGSARVAGGAASTADLTSATVGHADGSKGSAAVTSAVLEFTGKRFTAGAMTVGRADGSLGTGQVHAARATIGADVIDIAQLTVGEADSSMGTAIVDQADVTLGGRAASIGGLVLGHAKTSQGTSDTTASLTYAGEGFAGGGDWVVGHAEGSRRATATVHDALADIQGGMGSTLRPGSLSVGTASGGSYSDIEITRAHLAFTGALFGADQLVVGRAEARSTDSAADVLSAEIHLDVQAAMLGTVHVGQAEAELDGGPSGGTARAQGALLDITADSFLASGAVTVGEVASNLTGGRAEASGAMRVRALAARAASLHVGVYTGDGSGDPASFADGRLTLIDTPMKVAGDAEIGVVHAGAGRAYGEIVLDASLLELGGGLTVGPGGGVTIPATGTARGTEYGAIDALAAQLDGTLELDLLYTPQVGDSWDVIRLPKGTAFGGDFAAVTIANLPASQHFIAEMTTDAAGDSIYRVRVTDIPEPTVLALLALGSALVLGRRPRRAGSAS